MSLRDILALPAQHLRRHAIAAIAVLAIILAAVVYPSDLAAYRAHPYDGQASVAVTSIENWGRHVNSIAMLAVPLVLRDWTGLQQLGVVAIAGLIATHGPKRLLNGVVIGGTRLGERPSGTNHNMPSGHSALASTAIWFLGRRYSWWWMLLTVPVTLLTMFARVMLNDHTISAVIAGCLIGLLVTALFVTRREKPAA